MYCKDVISSCLIFFSSEKLIVQLEVQCEHLGNFVFILVLFVIYVILVGHTIQKQNEKFENLN